MKSINHYNIVSNHQGIQIKSIEIENTVWDEDDKN